MTPTTLLSFFDTGRFWVEDSSVEEFLAFLKDAEQVAIAGQRPERITKPVRARDWRRKIIGEALREASPDVKEFYSSMLLEMSTQLAEESITSHRGAVNRRPTAATREVAPYG